MASHCSIPAWRIPWTEEPGRLPTVHRGQRELDMTQQLNNSNSRGIELWHLSKLVQIIESMFKAHPLCVCSEMIFRHPRMLSDTQPGGRPCRMVSLSGRRTPSPSLRCPQSPCTQCECFFSGTAHV